MRPGLRGQSRQSRTRGPGRACTCFQAPVSLVRFLISFGPEAPHLPFIPGSMSLGAGPAFRQQMAGSGSHMLGCPPPPALTHLARPLHSQLGCGANLTAGHRKGPRQWGTPGTACVPGNAGQDVEAQPPCRWTFSYHIFIQVGKRVTPGNTRGDRRGLRLRGPWGPCGFTCAALGLAWVSSPAL